MTFDYKALKNYIDATGLKQRTLAIRSGVPEVQLCMILQGKRKCEVGEYASICEVLGIEMERFIKEKAPVTLQPDA